MMAGCMGMMVMMMGGGMDHQRRDEDSRAGSRGRTGTAR